MTEIYPSSLSEVVDNGLCIGCGLCAAQAENLQMKMNCRGEDKPVGHVTATEEQQLLSLCPGAVVSAHIEAESEVDDIWGAYHTLVMSWSAEPDIRYKASTGGVLTAMGRHVLDSGIAAFVLQVGADPDDPLRSTWFMSETADQVLARAGSRYGPVRLLEGVDAALQREEPFLFIGKPCDCSVMRRLMATDRRAEHNCMGIITMVCGGASRLTKTTNTIDALGINREDIETFRYRGYGTPGPHRVIKKDGSYQDIDYNTMWGRDQKGWQIQDRCKICADPIGESADIAAADTWIDGKPLENDEGFNGLLLRTKRGQKLVETAVEHGKLALGGPLSVRQFDLWQPHNVRKKQAVKARLAGLIEAGHKVTEFKYLRIDELSNAETFESEKEGSLQRAIKGDFQGQSDIIQTDRS